MAAITGKFAADFTPFFTAVQQADASLKDFQAGAGRVGTSLDNMANAFSGKKVLEQAALMEKAFQDLAKQGIGLTTSELQRMGATAQEATEKMRAMGIEVPPGIQKIADAAKEVTKAQQDAKKDSIDFGGTLRDLAASVGVGFSIGAVVEFGKAVIEAGSQINDMSERLGISTDAVQGFKYAAEQTGSSLDAVGSALNKMNEKLAEAAPTTIHALTDLHLKFDDIRSMKPEDAFLAITDALQAMKDPMEQARLRTELLGKGAKELGPAITEGFRKLASEAPKMSAEAIAACDQVGDAWNRLSLTVKAKSAEIIASSIAMAKGVTSSWAEFKLFTMQALTGSGVSALAFAGAMQMATDAAKQNHDVNLPLAGVHHKTKEELDAEAAAAKKLAEALAAMTAAQTPLTFAQQERATALLKLKLTEDEVATIMHVNVGAIRAYEDAVKTSNEATAEADKITAMWAKTTEDMGRQARGLADFFEKQREKEADSIAHAQTATIATFAEYTQRVNDMTLSGTDLRIAQITRERDARLAALRAIPGQTAIAYNLAAAPVNAYYQHLLDLANKTQDTIEDRMLAHGVFTQAQQAENVADLERDYDQMVADGNYNADQLEAAWKRWNQAAIAESNDFAAHAEAIYGALSQALQQVASDATASGHAVAGAALTSFSGLTKNLKDAQKANNEFGGSAGIASALFSDQASSTEKWASAAQSGAAIAGGAMNVWAATANAGGKAAGAFKGAMAGAEAGAAFGPWGAAIGGVAGALTGFIRNLSAGRKAVEDFAGTFGGFDALHTKLDALPNNVGETLWKELTQGTAKGDPAAAKAAIDKVTKALADADAKTAAFNTSASTIFGQIASYGGNIDASLQPYLADLEKAGNLSADNVAQLQKMSGDGKPTYEQLDALAKKYNLTIDQMGAGFQGAKIHDEYQTLIDDMDELTRGGVDLGAVLTKVGADGTVALSDLGSQVQNVIDQSQKYGQDVPENMRPAAQALIDQGQLLDANGQKITDINSIKFGESMQTSLDKLNDTLKELVQTLTGNGPNSVKGALETVGSTVVSPTIKPTIEMPDMPAMPAYGGAQAEGGDYWVTKPTLFLAGEAGPERASFGGGPASALVRSQATPASGGVVTKQPIVVQVDGMKLLEVVATTATNNGVTRAA
jgi:transcriptional regulator with XRE-family HTH domain/DNA-binding transcriptional regulator YiaG